MPEFKIKCEYQAKDKQKLLNDRNPNNYHKFFADNYASNLEFAEYCVYEKGFCYLWIADYLVKSISKNFEIGKEYQFIITLGEAKAANFKHKVKTLTSENNYANNMILKSREYFEDTVKRIGFWGKENYFYERKGNDKKNNSQQDESENNLGKVFLFALPIVLFALFFFLIIKWVSKRKIIKYK